MARIILASEIKPDKARTNAGLDIVGNRELSPRSWIDSGTGAPSHSCIAFVISFQKGKTRVRAHIT